MGNHLEPGDATDRLAKNSANAHSRDYGTSYIFTFNEGIMVVPWATGLKPTSFHIRTWVRYVPSQPVDAIFLPPPIQPLMQLFTRRNDI